jgi:hypothetical protein
LEPATIVIFAMFCLIRPGDYAIILPKLFKKTVLFGAGMMKRTSVILLAVFFFKMTTAGYGGTVAAPYQVGTWSGFRAAAITYTFDDGYMAGLYNTAIPMFNEPNFGYKLTAYPVINWCGGYWSNLQAAAAVGHEVGNHTVSHPDNWCSLSSADQAAQYTSSQSTINSYIPGNQCLTVAYPYCCVTNQSTVATYFIAGRTCTSTNYNPATPSNFYAIQSAFLGSAGTNTLAGITTLDDAAAANGGWMVFTIHALDSDSGYSPLSSTILRQSLDYLAARRSTFWVNTFLNVVKYIRERNDVSVSETSNTGNTITLSITDTLSNTIYNYPITIRRPLPDGWTGAIVKQNDIDVNASVVTVGPTQYVMFDVVPDGGSVVLYKLPYLVPSGLVAMPEVTDILLKWDNIYDSHVAGYNVYRSFISGSLYNKLNTSLLTYSNYTDTDVVSYSVPMYYVVTTVDTTDTESEYSNEVWAIHRIAAGVGAVLQEWWMGIEGNDVGSLTSDVNYPDNPAGKSLLPTLSGPADWQDNYGTRIRGYIYPPEDGDYTFWIASDANSELWLSTDADSANAVRIAYVPDYTDVQQWNKYTEQQSSTISLVGGLKYYIEVLHKAGLGNDHVEVAWQGPYISQQVIDGLSLSPCCLEFGAFSSFASQWSQSECSEENNWCNGADLNRNGVIDLGDMKEFTSSWLGGL